CAACPRPTEGRRATTQLKLSLPGTGANVGSAFDAVGLAVTRHKTATFEESDKLDISAADGTRIPRGESNLIYRSAKSLFDRVGKRKIGRASCRERGEIRGGAGGS